MSKTYTRSQTRPKIVRVAQRLKCTSSEYLSSRISGLIFTVLKSTERSSRVERNETSQCFMIHFQEQIEVHDLEPITHIRALKAISSAIRTIFLTYLNFILSTSKIIIYTKIPSNHKKYQIEDLITQIKNVNMPLAA